jgi:hypothetical protein
MKYMNEFIPVWSKSLSKPTYSCSITNLLGGTQPEIMVCCEDELFRAYNLAGKELLQMPFSSNITQFMASAITGTRKIELVSGDSNGFVRMVGLDGKQIWKTEVGSPVSSMDIGDVINNGKKEIIVGLQNRHIIVLDYLGAIRYNGEAPQPVADVTLGFLTNTTSETMMVALKTGEVYALDIDSPKEWRILFSTPFIPTCITFYRADQKARFLIGDNEGKVHLFDLEGIELGHFWAKELVRDIDKEFIDQNGSKKLYIVIAAGKTVQVLELKEDRSKPIDVAKQIASGESASGDLKEGYCPDCGKKIPVNILSRVQTGFEAFCEACGARLVRKY